LIESKRRRRHRHNNIATAPKRTAVHPSNMFHQPPNIVATREGLLQPLLNTIFGEHVGAEIDFRRLLPNSQNFAATIETVYANKDIKTFSVYNAFRIFLNTTNWIYLIANPQITNDRNFTFQELSFNLIPHQFNAHGVPGRTNSYQVDEYKYSTRTANNAFEFDARVFNTNPEQAQFILYSAVQTMAAQASMHIFLRVFNYLIAAGDVVGPLSLAKRYRMNPADVSELADALVISQSKTFGIANRGYASYERRLDELLSNMATTATTVGVGAENNKFVLIGGPGLRRVFTHSLADVGDKVQFTVTVDAGISATGKPLQFTQVVDNKATGLLTVSNRPNLLVAQVPDFEVTNSGARVTTLLENNAVWAEFFHTDVFKDVQSNGRHPMGSIYVYTVRDDNYQEVKMSNAIQNCGVWDYRNLNVYSDFARQYVDYLNRHKSDFKGYVYTTSDLLQSGAPFSPIKVDHPGFEQVFVYMSRKDDTFKLVEYVGQMSPSALRNATLKSLAQLIVARFPDLFDAIERLREIAADLNNRPFRKSWVDALVAANQHRFYEYMEDGTNFRYRLQSCPKVRRQPYSVIPELPRNQYGSLDLPLVPPQDLPSIEWCPGMGTAGGLRTIAATRLQPGNPYGELATAVREYLERFDRAFAPFYTVFGDSLILDTLIQPAWYHQDDNLQPILSAIVPGVPIFLGIPHATKAHLEKLRHRVNPVDLQKSQEAGFGEFYNFVTLYLGLDKKAANAEQIEVEGTERRVDQLKMLFNSLPLIHAQLPAEISKIMSKYEYYEQLRLIMSYLVRTSWDKISPFLQTSGSRLEILSPEAIAKVVQYFNPSADELYAQWTAVGQRTPEEIALPEGDFILSHSSYDVQRIIYTMQSVLLSVGYTNVSINPGFNGTTFTVDIGATVPTISGILPLDQLNAQVNGDNVPDVGYARTLHGLKKELEARIKQISSIHQRQEEHKVYLRSPLIVSSKTAAEACFYEPGLPALPGDYTTGYRTPSTTQANAWPPELNGLEHTRQATEAPMPTNRTSFVALETEDMGSSSFFVEPANVVVPTDPAALNNPVVPPPAAGGGLPPGAAKKGGAAALPPAAPKEAARPPAVGNVLPPGAAKKGGPAAPEVNPVAEPAQQNQPLGEAAQGNPGGNGNPGVIPNPQGAEPNNPPENQPLVEANLRRTQANPFRAAGGFATPQTLSRGRTATTTTSDSDIWLDARPRRRAPPAFASAPALAPASASASTRTSFASSPSIRPSRAYAGYDDLAKETGIADVFSLNLTHSVVLQRPGGQHPWADSPMVERLQTLAQDNSSLHRSAQLAAMIYLMTRFTGTAMQKWVDHNIMPPFNMVYLRFNWFRVATHVIAATDSVDLRVHPPYTTMVVDNKHDKGFLLSRLDTAVGPRKLHAITHIKDAEIICRRGGLTADICPLQEWIESKGKLWERAPHQSLLPLIAPINFEAPTILHWNNKRLSAAMQMHLSTSQGGITYSTLATLPFYSEFVYKEISNTMHSVEQELGVLADAWKPATGTQSIVLPDPETIFRLKSSFCLVSRYFFAGPYCEKRDTGELVGHDGFGSMGSLNAQRPGCKQVYEGTVTEFPTIPTSVVKSVYVH
jgi:hypothetical protein